MKVTIYKVLANGTLEELVPRINEQILSGWQPLGGVAPLLEVVKGGRSLAEVGVMQAMVKYAEPYAELPATEGIQFTQSK